MADKILQAWQGIDSTGKRLKGKIYAFDFKEANHELQRQNITLIDLKPIKTFQFGKKKKKKVKTKHILLFTRYLTTMMAAGLPILQALDILAQDKENENMHDFILNLRSNISSGKTLSESFAAYPEYFGEMYCSLIRAGEKSGALEKILKRLASYLERSESLRAKIKKALMYPIAIFSIAFLVSAILLIFVVPQFEKMFASFGAKLPAFTQMIMNLSHFVRNFWYIILTVISISIWKFRKEFKNNEKFRLSVDRKLLNLPVIGTILTKGIISRFARTLSTTLEAGMPISEAMQTMVQVVGNSVFSKAIIKIREDLISGHNLSVALINVGIFPNMVIQMVGVGEAAGSLSEMLAKIADYYEEEVNNIVDSLSSLIEPLIMVVLGVLIGGLVIAMYLPIFKLGSIL